MLNYFEVYIPGLKFVDKLTKLSKISFSMECFSSDFLVEMSKFAFRVADWLLSIKCKHFGGFLEIFYFPNIWVILSFLVKRNCEKSYTMKNFTNVLCKIIVLNTITDICDHCLWRSNYLLKNVLIVNIKRQKSKSVIWSKVRLKSRFKFIWLNSRNQI